MGPLNSISKMSTDNFTCAGDWWKGALMEFTTSAVYTWASAVVSAVAVLSAGGDEHAAMINEPFVNGIVLAALMYISIDVSGGHVNPIFSFAQLVGAFAGGLFAWASTGTGGLRNPANLGARTDVPDVHNNEDYNVGNAFILDIVLTVFIGYVYQVVMVDKRDLFAPIGPLAVGLSHFCAAYPATALTGGHFNPARSLALGVLAGEADEIFFFLVAPFIGVGIAVLAYNYLFTAVDAPKAGAAVVPSDYSYESSSSSYFDF